MPLIPQPPQPQIVQPQAPPKLNFNQAATGTGQLATDSTGQVIQHGIAPLGSTTPAPKLSVDYSGTVLPGIASPTQASPVDDMRGQIKALQDKYLSTITPSQQETDLTTKLGGLDSQFSDIDAGLLKAQSAARGLEGQGRGIPIGIVRGQESKLLAQADLDAQARSTTLTGSQKTLQAQLAALQAQRTGQGNVLNASLGFANNSLNDFENQENKDYTRSLAATQSAKQDAQQAKSEQTSASNFALQNGITTPFYNIGGTIYRTSDNKAYSSPEEYFADGGAKDFSNAPEIKAQSEDKLLSVAEAKSLGVPYGTTQSQAAQKGIVQKTGSGNADDTPKKITVSEATNLADQYLRPKRGAKDGFVSPEDFEAARQAWVDDGLDVNEFYSRFKKYINPADPQDY